MRNSTGPVDARPNHIHIVPRMATSDQALAHRTEEVLGDIERCMSHLDVHLPPERLVEAAERIARHELERSERVGWWPR